MSGEGVLRSVGLFPLPRLVLFPGALMPLHIFEPRYRALVHDSLAQSKLLCLANSNLALPSDAFGQPALEAVAGLGEIVRHEKLSDGRYNILVLGKQRVRIVERPFTPPYRIADLQLLSDAPASVEQAQLQALVGVARSMMREVREAQPGFNFELPVEEDASRLVDVCTHYLVADSEIRQQLLETLDVQQRLQLCLDTLLEQRANPSSRNVTN